MTKISLGIPWDQPKIAALRVAPAEGCANSLGRYCVTAPSGTRRGKSLGYFLQRGHTSDAAVRHQVERQPRWN